MKKNIIISVLLVILILTVIYAYSIQQALDTQKELTNSYSRQTDSLRVELKKVNDGIRANYERAQYLFQQTVKQEEEALKLAKEREAKKKN
jgi:uncharacterized protein YxeA